MATLRGKKAEEQATKAEVLLIIRQKQSTWIQHVVFAKAGGQWVRTGVQAMVQWRRYDDGSAENKICQALLVSLLASSCSATVRSPLRILNP